MPPDNRGFTIVAYIVIGLVYGGYALSLWLRARQLK